MFVDPETSSGPTETSASTRRLAAIVQAPRHGLDEEEVSDRAMRESRFHTWAIVRRCLRGLKCTKHLAGSVAVRCCGRAGTEQSTA